MKLTKETLKRIIKEEIENTLNEGFNTKVYEEIENIVGWAEDNGLAYGEWENMCEAYFNLFKDEQLNSMAKEAGYDDADTFKTAVLELGEDEYTKYLS